MKNIIKASLLTALLLLVPMFLPMCGTQVCSDSLTVFASTSVTVNAVTAKSKDKKYQVKVSQKKVNYTNGSIKIYKYKKLKKIGIRKIVVTANMYYGKSIMRKVSKTIKMSKISAKKNIVNIKFPAFGKYKVKVAYYAKSKKAKKTLTLKNVGVVATEYNVATLNGTFGPMLFTMNLWNDGVVNNSTTKAPIPTFVVLSRPDAYNWSKLPKNVYSNPLAKSPKAHTIGANSARLAAYIKDLHQMNKNSRFHVYLADNAVKRLLDLMYSNRINDNLFDVTFLSDGTASYSYFNSLYNVEGKDPASTLELMKGEWNATKNAFLYGSGLDVRKLKYAIGDTGLGLSKYTYAVVSSQANASWWVARVNDTFKSTNADFLATAKSQIKEVGINPMLQNIQNQGPQAIRDFKALYHFSDEMFADATKSHKKVMILMGHRANLEKNYEEFAKYVMKKYGKQYMYYYKGHPATPTKLYPEKQAQLQRLGIRDVESSIAAELILFFYPDVYVSGMSNSTLNGSYKAGHTYVYMGSRLADRGNINNGDVFQSFFTKITSSYEPEIQALCTKDPKLEHSFLIEYNDGSGNFAIYDSSSNTITEHSASDLQSIS